MVFGRSHCPRAWTWQATTQPGTRILPPNEISIRGSLDGGSLIGGGEALSIGRISEGGGDAEMPLGHRFGGRKIRLHADLINFGPAGSRGRCGQPASNHGGLAIDSGRAIRFPAHRANFGRSASHFRLGCGLRTESRHGIAQFADPTPLPGWFSASWCSRLFTSGNGFHENSPHFNFRQSLTVPSGNELLAGAIGGRVVAQPLRLRRRS